MMRARKLTQVSCDHGVMHSGKLALIMMLAATSIAAQERLGEVSGRVVSSRDNEPLALVQVELAGTPFTGVTASDGTFRLTGVPAGTYALQAASVGYRIVRQDF